MRYDGSLGGDPLHIFIPFDREWTQIFDKNAHLMEKEDARHSTINYHIYITELECPKSLSVRYTHLTLQKPRLYTQKIVHPETLPPQGGGGSF